MCFDYGKICKFLYSEARCLDDKDFESWLQFYDKNVEFWMPAWDDDGDITKNPRNEISLIYYDNRSGLEDRIFRVQTERSGASSVPDPRTLHSISNIEIIDGNSEVCSIRYNWITKSFRYNKVNTFFGVTFVDLVSAGNEGFLITRKKVILKNDYIDQVLDVYHI
ncbi:benzoate 1,2-dioxygenase small subunit [Marinobacter adhaerens]|jgi:benzoate/toluate 1,2-dioxygenase beta subunit|uniref:Benzoate 1,2-dioxygenase small subunit n=1 Tax=Marinobacter adhaerens TaxID=1033846 RepID=A0ABX8IM30_9GAMM|nr:aromatic-ring-hydroxylating dioxygenase subunit beta [Marinobacter adhaerens]MCR9189982.1 benzoate 1,2-dioxygenase small subunit [Alteromonadaceae bacterium]MTI77744.1 benzoate 1,2-dioxygenase small subunit [Marinobacter sp.]ODM28839.1 benzoate 1,2-dioxygenase small subunit [Marinobacter adhaerens]QWV14825.1 benzoate 1,2-dioxygenase small subunit [Marinobacter adhaerens]